MSRWTDIATWRGPTANQGGPASEQRGLVVHIAEGGFEGTISWQKNPAAQVSSHFVVAKDGRIAQVVDTAVTAWTQRAGNGHWVSIENEGFSPGALTAAQVEANAQILARGYREHGWPLQLATSPAGRGLGHHSMGTAGRSVPTDTWTGATWGHEQCPGPAIIAQKPAILARAIDITNGIKRVESPMFLANLGTNVFMCSGGRFWIGVDGPTVAKWRALQPPPPELNVANDVELRHVAGLPLQEEPAPTVIVDPAALAAALQDPAFLAAVARAVNDDAAARQVE